MKHELDRNERIEYIKKEWEKFLEKNDRIKNSYYENISRAKSPKQLKQIVGIQQSIRQAIDEDKVLLSEDEISLITQEILSRSAFEEDSDYDSRLVRSYYKPSYFSYNVYDMITNNVWELCENEHYLWETEFVNFQEKFEYKYEKSYSLIDVVEKAKSPSLFRTWQNIKNDE